MTDPPRQTLSYVQRRLAETGVRLSGRHGQNFLVDLNLLQLLVDAAALGPHDVVLEVGTGTGSLAALLAPRVAALVTVEIDSRLQQLAEEELAGFANVTLLKHDALSGKHAVDPRVLAALAAQLAAGPGRQLKLVANLPYSIATPLVANLLIGQLAPRSMTVTIQKELADRLAAAPGTADYGALSILVQSQCQVQLVRLLPPTAFWPRPKVHSAIVHLVLDPAARERIGDRQYFAAFVRGLFLHRRKLLRSALAAACPALTKADADRLLAACGLPADARAEALDPATMLALAQRVRAAAGDVGQP